MMTLSLLRRKEWPTYVRNITNPADLDITRQGSQLDVKVRLRRQPHNYCNNCRDADLQANAVLVMRIGIV